MADETPAAPAVSPTGKPLIDLPPWAMAILVALSASAGAIYTFFDLTPAESKACVGIGFFCATLLGTTPGMRRKVLPLALLVLNMSLFGCSTVTPFIVTGDSLDAVGKQFTETSVAMYNGCSRGKVEPDTCRAWRDFSERFKPGFDLAVTGWKGALVVNDAAKRGQVAGAIGALGAELGVYIVDLQRLKLLPGGAP